ncbi:MAG: hypothetical protein V1822_02035 [Candidatus Micrarchaeota archaeon]
MAHKSKLNLRINEIVRELEAKEKAHDSVISKSRPIVRKCANAIKMLHFQNVAEAKKEIESLEKELAKLPKFGGSWDYLLEPIWQEAVEAKLLVAAIEHWPLPDYKKLGVPASVYLLGLCDCIGEFRRQMLEEIKAGRAKEADYYFELMQEAYEQMSVIRFSNSVLPSFRRKQDVARGQLEHARSEILRAERE